MVEQPDVVVITAHDLGRHLHCYGVESVVSPNLDQLAGEGVMFRRAFATAPQCSPSRASVATGRFPHCNGVMGLAHPGFDWELAPGELHVATILAGQGFETHLFGLQHVTLHPDRLGFKAMHATPSDRGKARGSLVADAVERFLGGAAPDRPLYLEINVEETHRPFDRPPPPTSTDVSIPPYLPNTPAAREEFSALQGSIKALDDAVGRIIAALNATGRGDRALVVFTTDHGLAMPRAKCTLYDPGLEVALMVRWPAGGLAAGAERFDLISNIDLLPTLLEAVDAPVPPAVQGRSFLPVLLGGRYQPRDAIFAEKTFHSYYDPMRAVRTAHHKYIRNFETGFAVDVPGDAQLGAIFRADPGRYSTDRQAIVELYDLDADPAERQNLAGIAAVESIERRLSAELWRWMEETADPLLHGPISSPRYVRAMLRPTLSTPQSGAH